MNRLYPSIDLEAGTPPPGAFPGADAANAWSTGIFGAGFVHSNMRTRGDPALRVDVDALVRQARAARSAWVGSKLKYYYEALVRRFARGGQSDNANYLAAVRSLAGLEERIGRHQRTQLPVYNDRAIAAPRHSHTMKVSQ
jgi:hypothetical protein